MKIKLLLSLFLLCLLCPIRLSATDNIFATQLRTINNEEFPLNQLSKNKASVIVFLLPECPACESYSKTLNDLRNSYKQMDIEFYGVFPGTYNTSEEMIAFQKTYKIKFPLLQDPKNLLVRRLKASIVPSVFLIDSKEDILYQGRIDDWLYALGKKRVKITKHELRDALSSFYSDKEILVKETEAIGCILEY